MCLRHPLLVTVFYTNKCVRWWQKPTNFEGVGTNQQMCEALVETNPLRYQDLQGGNLCRSQRDCMQYLQGHMTSPPGSHHIISRVTSHGHFTSTSSPGYKIEISANLKETVCSKFPEHRCFKEGVYFHGTTLALSKLLCSLKWHTSLYVVVCKSCSKKVRGYHIYMCVRACREDL